MYCEPKHSTGARDLLIIMWMQYNQNITKAYMHCMQNCAVCKEYYSENTKPNLMEIGNFLHEFWKSGEWKLLLPNNFVAAGNNHYESRIDEAHVATAHVGVDKTMQYLTAAYQSQSVSVLVRSFVASCDSSSKSCSGPSLR